MAHASSEGAAVEPQPAAMRALRLIFARDAGVTLVPAAVAARHGTVSLRLNTRNPTVSSASSAFVAAAAGAPGWLDQRWDVTVEVPAVTLDDLVARHGMPDFLKIDVEGFEAEALADRLVRVGEAEALVLAEKCGVDPARVVQAISRGAAQCWALDNKPEKLFQRDLSPGFKAHMQAKDLKIVVDTGRTYGVPLPQTAIAHQLYEAMLAMGNSELDNSAIVTVLEALANVTVGEADDTPAD